MPIVKNHSYLINYIREMGYFTNNGTSLQSLSFLEIKAYIDLMKLNLSVWEISTLKELSTAYVSQYNTNYVDINAPYENTITANELDALFRNADSFKKSTK